jgi:hypothetical protein
MKTINFYDIKSEKIDSEQLTKIFKTIEEELQYHFNSYGQYPKKIHAYFGGLGLLNMMAGPNPTKNTMVICIDL